MENKGEQSWILEEVHEYANAGDFGISDEELSDLLDSMCGY